MRICLIVDDYVPDSIKVAAKMMHELSIQFTELGHEVTVVTPGVGLHQSMDLSVIDGVKVCRFSSGRIKNVNKVTRAINESLLSFRAWISCRRFFKENPHDLIIYYSPSIFWGRLVSKLKRLWSCSSYLILRDFFPQWCIDNGILSANSPITKYFRFFEWLNYRAADTIAIQSPKSKSVFTEMTQTDKSLDVLCNWASDTPVGGKAGHYRKKLGLEEKVVFFYGGNIGHAQDMMNIVRLAKSLKSDTRAHFVLVGTGDEFELVNKSIDEHGLTNMTLLPPVNQEEYKKMLAEFDIGLFSLHREHKAHNFPGKLLGYMVEEKPILGSINPDNDLKPVVEGAGAGSITVNGDDHALVNNALKLIEDEQLRKAMGKNSKKLLRETFSVEAAAQKILSTAGNQVYAQ